MVRRGHQVLFVSTGTSNKSCSYDGIQILSIFQKKASPFYHYVNPFLMLKFKKILAEFIPDIIHVHNINLQTFSLCALLFSHKYPMVWTLHDVWPFCITGWPPIPDCSGLAQQCRSCPTWPGWMVMANTVLKETVYKYSKLHVVSPSDWMASLLSSRSLGRHPVDIIHNAIDPSLFYRIEHSTMKERLHIPNRNKVILFCGGKRLADQLPAWRKGWEYFYKALEILNHMRNDLHLLYVGDPLELSQSFSFPVTFLQNVPRHDMKEYYSIADAFVIPTLADNFPLTILEAMACKTPIVATGTGGIPEAIISGETGLLCSPRNSSDLAEKIDYLLSNPVHGAEMVERAYNRIGETFSFERMIDRYESVYQRAASRFYAVN